MPRFLQSMVADTHVLRLAYLTWTTTAAGSQPCVVRLDGTQEGILYFICNKDIDIMVEYGTELL